MENVHFAAEGEEGEEAEEEDIPEWRGGEDGEHKMCDQLLDSQKVQIQKLLHEFQEVMSSTPGHPKLYTASSSQTRNPSDLLHIGFHMPIGS